jgi:PAS domain S-box-containing protein
MTRRPALALLLTLPMAEACAGPAAAATSGVVLYSDREWGRLYVHDGERVRAVPAVGLASFPDPHRRVEIDGPVVRDLGPAEPPGATPLEKAPADGLHWVAAEAMVRAVRAEEQRQVLRVHTRAGPVDVFVRTGRTAEPPTPSPGARVRLRGVLEPAADAWSRPRLWVAGGDAVVTTVPATSWEDLRRVSVVEAVALARAGREEEVVLTARLSGRRSAGSFDATGTLAAALDRPELAREGATIELRGFPTTRRGEPVLADARWRSGGPSSFDVSRRDTGLALLTKVSQVRALSRSEAERGHPVRLDAVATYVSGAFRQLFVQDETGGLYVAIERRDAGIAVGDRVRVEGFTAPGGLAPVVVDPELRRLGPGRLPPATRASAARLAAGHEDCQRVEIEGLVRQAMRGEADSGFLLAVEGERIPVHLPPEWRDAPLPPVDARVRVRGVGGSHFNWRNQFDRAELFVPTPGDVVVEEAPPDPLLLPVVPVRDVLRTGSSGRWQRLVRTRGVVLRHREGQPLYLRDASGTLVVDSDGVEPLVPGDEVEVLGFPAPGPAVPRLEDASFRRVAPGPAPEPTVLAGNRLGHALEADLARLQARLIEVVPREEGVTLLLQAAEGVVEAHGDGELDPAPPRGSLLEVTGVLLPHDHGDGGAPGLRVLLRSPGDVRLLESPPWLTPQRAAWSVGGLAAAAALALAWVATLRRRVSVRTAELRATEERYRLLADSASDLVVTVDPSLRVTYVSPSVTRDSGYTIEEALAMPLERVVTKASFERLRAALDRAESATSDSPVEFGLEMVRKDGALRYMHVRASALRGPDGALAGFRAAARDVTARRRAQQETARLAAAIEQSADSIVLTDPGGRILYVNPAFERTTGYPASEVLGGTAGVLKSGIHDKAFYDALWETLRAGRTWVGRFTNRRKDGSLFLEDATISPVRESPDRRLIGYVAVKRDVTRQVRLEGELTQSQKMEAVGRLAAGIAHDFNNVLAIILSLAALALKRGPDERAARCLDGIREAALRGSGLTRQILTFGRQSPSVLHALDPREVVAEAARMLRLLVPAGVTVEERLESTGFVAADATQLHQVVANLGMNAGLSMQAAGGVVEIALEDARCDHAFADEHRPLRPGPCVRLSVRDTGAGMSPETLARLFEPFFTTRGPGEGTGMGLAVVHGIVQNHGGATTVESAPGKGSTFCVYLPALPAPPRGEDALAPEPD